MKNIGKVPLQRSSEHWKASKEEDKPTDDEFERGVDALDYFLRGYLAPKDTKRMMAVQSDNYGERTLAIYLHEKEVFSQGYIEACQTWLRMPEWSDWRILIKAKWKNSIDLVLYSDVIFLDASRQTIHEAFERMRG